MSLQNNTCTVCFLYEDSIESFLLACTNNTRSSIKKYSHLSAKDRSRKYLPKAEVRIAITLLNHGEINPVYNGPEIIELQTDDCFSSFDVAPFVHSLPHSYYDQKNVLSFLRMKQTYHEELAVRQNDYSRGMINRIDFVTSGLIIFTKKSEIAILARSQYASLVTEKIYLAIVEGELKKIGTYIHYLKGSGKNKHKIACSNSYCDKSLRAELEVLEASYDKHLNWSLVKISLKTGHRHQIRAQLSFLGHPVVGDDLYSGPKHDRVYLHSAMYKMQFQNKKWIFKSKHFFGLENFFNLEKFV